MLRSCVAHGLGKLRFGCTQCGNCCRKFRVPLTDADLIRLVAETGRPPDRIVDWLSPDQVDMTGEPESFVELPEGRRLMTLGWSEGGCQFLELDRCSVYPARPLSCRLFPFHATLGRKGGVRRLQLLPLDGCDHDWAGRTPAVVVARTTSLHRQELRAYVLRLGHFNRLQGQRRRLGKPLLEREAFFARLLSAG